VQRPKEPTVTHATLQDRCSTRYTNCINLDVYQEFLCAGSAAIRFWYSCKNQIAPSRMGFGVGLNSLKINLITCIPNPPGYHCPLL